MNPIELVKKYVNEYGLNVLPTRPKLKAPDGASWKKYQETRITDNEIDEKFKNADLEVVRIGIVSGKISGNLEILDFDNKLSNAEEIYNEFLKLPAVREIVERCPVEKTQSGGFHIYYRCKEIEGNKKLADWPAGRDENGKEKYECVIETRGEGGFCVCAPSKGYELIHGGFGEIPELSAEERDTLISSARSFDRKHSREVTGFKDTKQKYDEKPWELYNESEEALDEVKKLLKEAGWSHDLTRNDQEYWRRPGKGSGVSATFRGNVFYVFSSSAYPFESERSYKPSGIYAVLNYGTEAGDFNKAVKDFISKGYGEPLKKPLGADIEGVESFLLSRYDFRINVVTGKLEQKLKSETEYHDADDYDISSIFRELQHMGISFSWDKLNNLLNSDFITKYDPFVEYFDSLPVWDGQTNYIELLSRTIELTDESKRDYWIKCLRKFLIALVACATMQDKTNETAITFFGKQGLGKTKWLNRLNPEKLGKKYLFVGSVNDDKDSRMNLSTKLLVNLDELGSLNKEEIGYLKSLFSIDQISLREPYMRKSKSYTGRASFVGSIDREEFLTDLSGTRRFLAFSVSKIDYQHNVDMDMVYSQAYALLKAGEKFYFDQSDIEEIEKNNDDFRLQSLEEGLLLKHFTKPINPSSAVALTTSEIAEELALYSCSFKATTGSIKALGQVLTKYGFERISKRRSGGSTKCWLVEKNQASGFNLGNNTP